LKLEKDAPNIVNTAIEMCRKARRVSLIGDYFGYVNHFNLGAMMEKHLNVNGGQLWPHNYYQFDL
jgi:threonine dehydrogenase-like Zn-dependent dehydrogenase